uniref:hypothetical protein n=1 Tax=Orrella sp. TaxID=1921583 RepID=UPI0040556862
MPTIHTIKVAPWEVVSKKAYWDRDVNLDNWRERLALGHRSYLPDAVIAMHAKEFLHFYGVKPFVQDWPRLRAQLPANFANRVALYDVFWSQLAGGGYNLKPTPDFYEMPKRRREFLIAVAKYPGKSIYEIAKRLDMQYRRAHDHAATLIEAGRIKGREIVEGGRRKIRLYPAYGHQISHEGG